MPIVKCPYCWTAQRPGELQRRCGERCDHAGSTFPARQVKNGRCPHGELPEGRRVCSGCGRGLLREYVESGGRNVAVIGSADAGKSTWVGVLVHQLQRGEVHERFSGMSLHLLGEESRERYRSKFWAPLFDEGRVLLQTPSALRENPEPLIFSLRFAQPARLLRPAAVTSLVTVFYDTAGEDVARAQSMDQLVTYLDAAEGIVLLLDPMQMPKVRQRMAGGAAAGQAVTDQLSVVSRLAELLRERSAGKASRRLRTPLAIALTKVDELRDTLDPSSPLARPSRHIGHYDEADGVDVHEEIRGWLSQWYDPALDRTVANTFETYRYFGLSALGTPPKGVHLAASGVHPYRAEDPILWLLSRFGVIRTVRARS